MKNAIEELIFQNSSFIDNIPYNDTYWQLIKENSKLYNKLKETLDKEQLKLLDKLINNHIDLEAESSDCHLLEGFKTGLKLMIECLT